MLYNNSINNYKLINETVNNKLYLNNNIVYKLYKREKDIESNPLPILVNKDIKHAINIKDIIYNDSNIKGCTTTFDKDWKSLSSIMRYKRFNDYEKKELFKTFFEFINILIDKYNIFYIDIHLRNIGISNNKIKFLDLDEALTINKKENFEDYKLITYDNLFVIMVQIILDEAEITNKIYNLVDYIFPMNENYTEIFKLENFINNYNEDKKNELIKILKK